ncbi:hypothetical protein V6N13_007728 [Hibiscus sabdariffa]|uniref:RNase H type-1 domain-containing protein n=1 Tax=Hibiscus sabdariffa TaxID=183260 RepID=A0ABR2EMT5_9ROSI
MLELELWGVYEGLKFAMSLNVSSLVVESNCLDIIRMINNINDYVTSSTVIGHIKQLFEFQWQITFVHVFQEGNKVVDAITKLFYLDSLDFRVFLVALDEVLTLVHNDCNSIAAVCSWSY